MRRRVVVTGIGCVTPLGTQIETVWKRLLAGESGVGYTTLFDASNFPTKISAEVRDWDLSEVGEDPKEWEHQGRHTHFAIGAARKAMADSGIEDAGVPPTRFGIYTGSGEGQQDFHRFTKMMIAGLSGGEEFDMARFTKAGLETLHPIAELEQEPNMPAGHLASLFGAEGPNINCLTACAASSQAIGEAVEIIRRGEADVMLSGGTHTMIHPFGVTGFNLLTALSTRNDEPTKASRPFDRDRDGFVLGEGSGMVVLEALEHAQARGAHIHGEVCGFGSTADAFRITDTHPEGRGAISCIKMALRDAEVNADEIDYINAHGPSTPLGDRVEVSAIKECLGKHSYRIPINSTKSMIGHSLAAAGVIEIVATIMQMKRGVVHPTINQEKEDPELDLDFVPNSARKHDVRVALSNSFGFGGINSAIVVGTLR